MTTSIPAALWEVLACPHCLQPLRPGGPGAHCAQCAIDFGCNEQGALDLRLRGEKSRLVRITLGPRAGTGPDPDFLPLPAHPAPEVDFEGVSRPHNLSREFLSHIPRARTRPSLMLDLGCGDAIHQPICEHAGYEWVGVDHAARGARILADAHALPFRDQSFDCALSVSVFEHIRHPLVAIEEVHRVLRPGAMFLGTVAFLEPFHGDSYYHHSHLGTLNTLRHAGFDVRYVAPFVHWSGLLALAQIGLFPRIPLPLASLLTAPLRWIHLLWWGVACRLRLTSPEKRLRNTTAAFAFVVRK